VRISVTVTISTVCPGASGGAIFSGRDDTGAPLRFVANRDRIFRAPFAGEVWSIDGEFQRHPTYGDQVHVEQASLVQPAGRLIIDFLLKNPAFDGLGMPSHLTVIFGAGNSGSGYIASALSILLNNSPGSPRSVTAVSAANGARVVAPGSIASIYGTNLAPGATAPGSFANLPTNLGGISLHVRDSFGADRLAQLFYVSPTQVNFLVPDATAEGLATINIDDGHLPFVEGLRATVVQMLAPSFFTADGTGTGAAAAVRVLPSGTQISVPAFTCSDGRCNTVPINVSQGPVYLTLYGTGFRHRSASQNEAPSAGCHIQNRFASVIYAGPQGPIPGLDQLNLLLPQTPGAGETDVVCTFSFYTQALSETALSPPVKINIE